MTWWNEIKLLAISYERHIVIGVVSFVLAYVVGFVHGHSRNRKS
jgi:hypothetical protein